MDILGNHLGRAHTAHQPHPIGDKRLCVIIPRQEQIGTSIQVHLPQLQPLHHAVDGGIHRHLRHVQQGHSGRNHFVTRQAGVTVAQIVTQHVLHTRLHAVTIQIIATQSRIDLVGSLKSDTQTGGTQQVRIGFDLSQGGRAKLLPATQRLIGAEAVTAKGHHHLAQAELGAEALPHLPRLG